MLHTLNLCVVTDAINIKILNAGAWARSSDRVSVSLPMELEDYIPQVEEFYKHKHSGRKLQWHHLMSNGIVRIYIFMLVVCGIVRIYIFMLVVCGIVTTYIFVTCVWHCKNIFLC